MDGFATKARLLHQGDLTIDDLNDELRNSLLILCNIRLLIAGFRNLFNYQRGNIGFHRWSGLKYFLFEYEESLRGKQLAHLTWKQYDNTSIEHIMPKNYSENWQNEMNTYQASSSLLKKNIMLRILF